MTWVKFHGGIGTADAVAITAWGPRCDRRAQACERIDAILTDRCSTSSDEMPAVIRVNTKFPLSARRAGRGLMV